MLVGCATVPPSNPDNLCEIFREKDDWFDAAADAEDRWGAPIQVMMAIVFQESRFQAEAKTPRTWYLGFIPGPRKSSAYGFAQAKDPVWEEYKADTGNSWADRDDFEDAIDFIGWYIYGTNKRLGISKWDARKQYLAYHEGRGGYARGTYRSKRWLLAVADKVARRASRYGAQLRQCRDELESWWPFW
jgi:hypothetical protein